MDKQNKVNHKHGKLIINEKNDEIEPWEEKASSSKLWTSGLIVPDTPYHEK